MSGKSDERNGAAGARELLYLAAAYALTLPVLFIPEALIAPSADLIALLRIACAGAFVWHAAALLRGKGGARWSAAALALATGLAWTALLVIYAYREITLLPSAAWMGTSYNCRGIISLSFLTSCFPRK